MKLKVSCPDDICRKRKKILFIYVETEMINGIFYLFCNSCHRWYKVEFNNSSPIITVLKKGYHLDFCTTPTLVSRK